MCRTVLFLILSSILCTIRAATTTTIDESLAKQAMSGDAEAQCLMGTFYQNGIGVPVNYEKAVEWYKMSAAKGNQRAQLFLAFAFQNGWGVKKDDAVAERIILKLANEGFPLGQRAAGTEFVLKYVRDQRAYLERHFGWYGGAVPGIETNAIEAYKWYSLASVAKQESADNERLKIENEMNPESIQIAQRLAAAFKPVQAVPLDLIQQEKDERERLAKIAAARVVERNRINAETTARVIAWNEQQASNGNSYAKFNLGVRYLNGDGIPTNRIRALELLRQSAAQTNTDAIKLLEKLGVPK